MKCLIVLTVSAASFAIMGAALADERSVSMPVEEAAYAAVSLSPGFLPDPQVVSGTSGGQTNATTMIPGCQGWIAGSEPDHEFTALGDFAHLRIFVASEGDTTLVIQRPDGSYACNDDYEGSNPLVELTSAEAGLYRIWVGSFHEGEYNSYKLGFSEYMSSVPSTIAP